MVLAGFTSERLPPLFVPPFCFLSFRSAEEAVPCAFADDIGSVIPSLFHLPKYFRAFNIFKRISALGLAPPQMRDIPFDKRLTPELARDITGCIIKPAPELAAFAIVLPLKT